MPMTFGASQGAAAPAYQTYQGMPTSFGSAGSDVSSNPYASLLGAGLGIASQFNPNTPGLAPGSTQSQLPSWMSGQWQNAFNAQNTAAANAQVSPFTAAQQQAMTNIQNSVGYQMPAIQQAQATAGNLANGVGAQQIQNFMSPYQQSAIQGTLNTMEQQRQQQDANINSQANAAGAWGGDRSAVANNLNDQSWNLSEGNVIGNMENSGYQNAVQSALGNQAAQLAGNQQFSNVIGQNINANTAQNQNLLTIGNQQQAQNQNVANLPFLRSQVIGQNLNPNVGGQQGYAQNPVTGAIAGLNSGLQLGNGIAQLVGGGGTAAFGAGGQIMNQALGVGQGLGGISGAYSGNLNDSTFYDQNQNSFVNDANNNLQQQFEMPSYSDEYTPPGYFSGAGGQAANLGEMTGTALGSTDNAAVAGFSTAPSLGDPGMGDVNNISQPDFNIQSGSSGLSASQGLGDASAALNIYNGLQRGGIAGYGGAALGAGKIYNSLAGSDGIPGLSIAGDALGIYNGVKQGGVVGYGSAALDAAQLYGAASAADVAAGGAGFAGGAGASALGAYVAPAAALYALYGLDQRQSQISPETLMGNFAQGAKTSSALANQYASGNGPAVYGTNAQAAAQANAGNAAADQAMEQMYAGMTPAQLNATMGIDNTIQLPPGESFGSAGGYGMSPRWNSNTRAS